MNELFTRAQTYVGTLYRVGEFDCADLAAQVQRELFGRVIALPAQRKRPAGARGQAREIARLQADLADRIDLPVDGCGALFHEPDGDSQLWHIGTMFAHAGDWWVLHNSHKLQSAALHRLSDVKRFGLRLDGFYAWRVA